MSMNNAKSKVSDAFRSRFSREPEILISAPGRVNLIGEHTDYNGLPVMPTSIPFTISVAASVRNDKTVSISNLDPSYDDCEYDLSGDIPHSAGGDWSNYVKAAHNEIMERFGLDIKGIDAVFSGSIPNSAGLSSSSALVIASALSLLAANGKELDTIELAEAMACGERYVGTQGGGMDQAICLLGKKDHAVKIDFFPLRFKRVPFPEGYSILVAHSLVRAAKTENALVHYNRRPAECRLATALINALYKPETPLSRLGDLIDRDFFKNFDGIEDFVENTFHLDSYSLEEVAKFTGDTAAEVTKKYLMTRSGEAMPEPDDGFLLKTRVMHVLTEADRVERSCRALEASDSQRFGALMNASHASCDMYYGISTPELNKLTQIMRDSGALGARLTGAGFGGCAVALVEDDMIEKIKAVVAKRYYTDYLGQTHPELLGTTVVDENILFALKPADGASVIRL